MPAKSAHCRAIACNKQYSLATFSAFRLAKKLSIAAVTVMLLGITGAYACQTQTIIVNGKITVCTVCGSVVNCF
jgi:hypothetical protein